MFFKLAFRNLWARKIKLIVIGLVIVFGSFIAVLGGAFVESITEGMRKSITYSVSGDMQIYSAKAKDKLSLIGSGEGDYPDIGEITDFKRIKTVLMDNIPEIQAVIPQGTNFGMLNPGNILDIKLEELRKFRGSRTEENALKEHIRQIVLNIRQTYLPNVQEIGSISPEQLAKETRDINRALSPSFWKGFDGSRNMSLEFLENRIAPLIYDDSMVYFLYLGTVPEDYMENFPLVEIVAGTAIPEGKRGFLFNQATYEEQIKHKVAYRLDIIKKDIDSGLRIKDEKELQDKVRANVEHVSDVYNQLNPLQAKRVSERLKEVLTKEELSSLKDDNVSDMLAAFFNMTDDNFKQRYDFFYKVIAPEIILYKIKIGDIFPLKTFTKSGYANSVNMKLYGVFKYRNFENSHVAGHFNVMDIMSFRDLYGYLTDERKAETRSLELEMERSIGELDISEDDVARMFDEKRTIVTKNAPARGQFDRVSIGRKGKGDIFENNYTKEQMEDGICLNAAIILKDPTKVQSVMESIRELNERENLGIKALDWKDSTGILGQFVFVIKAVLYIFITIVFLIAMFIIMNSMLMATMERVREIGTMRAIGAQRSYVLRLILAETFMISAIFGGIGILFGVTAIEVLHYVGVPAPTEFFLFLFSGPKLYPSVEPKYIFTVFILIIMVSLIASYYPSLMATKVSPIRAMQRDE